ncbi:natural cytotoxicity triggering receptor 2-like isoform X2 [Xiphophorus maculatus]|uniref:natural cytotoxicity triggering receptor 2-like isoform X2 n=1 Tax=Xiphophorus maculatus TaxID=8083 RepID=UPI000C6E8EA2|nr:natural cytotoxicity triggering receptor 2-like isoform X2 [Xiphophorus maculatus]
MKVRLTLICLFFLTLQDGETMRTYTENEEGNITVRCEFRYSGGKRFLCKETCEGKNILIVTTKDKDQRGRFSIRYERRNIFSFDFLHVSITDLKPSDSGRYRCRSDETLDGTLYDNFYLVVIEASTTTATTTSRRTTAAATAATTATAATQNLQLYVVLSLVVKIILLSTPLVIFCRKRRTMKSKDSAVETENDGVNHECLNIYETPPEFL